MNARSMATIDRSVVDRWRITDLFVSLAALIPAHATMWTVSTVDVNHDVDHMI